ncbi:MAG TPA: hypothetical protein VFO12_07715 [Sphingomicrobium sp.]|nr:hypothetical protein [Sphingomicrobium sp.]
MGEPKAFASLSSGLLARKGAARPAMRPQGFGAQTGAGLEDLGWNDMGFEPPKPAMAPLRDEDHDAFGEELPDQPLRNPISALTPIASPVHDQQAEIASRFASQDEDGEDDSGEYVDETAELYDPESEEVGAEEREPAPVVVIPQRAAAPARPRKSRAAPGSKGKSAFTLRLDQARHLKLRLACAVDGRSAQQLVTDALDRLLSDMPELESMAERAPRKKSA